MMLCVSLRANEASHPIKSRNEETRGKRERKKMAFIVVSTSPLTTSQCILCLKEINKNRQKDGRNNIQERNEKRKKAMHGQR